MNKEVLIDVGSQLAHLRMYPVFDVCHYLLTSLQVRDDIQQHQTGNNLSLVIILMVYQKIMTVLLFYSDTKFHTSSSIIMLAVNNVTLFFWFNFIEFFTW
jgi:hypothetical protein